MKSKLTKAELLEWLEHPATRELRSYLRTELEALVAGWKAGNYTHERVDGTAQKNAEALGKVQAYEDILSTLNQLDDEEADDDH